MQVNSIQYKYNKTSSMVTCIGSILASPFGSRYGQVLLYFVTNDVSLAK